MTIAPAYVDKYPVAISRYREPAPQHHRTDWLILRWCPSLCGAESTTAKFIREDGYMTRTVLVRCMCGTLYHY